MTDRLADQCTQYLKQLSVRVEAENSDVSHLQRLALELVSDVLLKKTKTTKLEFI